MNNGQDSVRTSQQSKQLYCKECDAMLYKAKVVFEIQTKLGNWVEDEIWHTDGKRAEAWVKRMGDKIKNTTVIY